MDKHQQRAVDEAPQRCRGILTKAYEGRASPRQAIKAFCLRCVGFVREDVTNCTAWSCPLHPYRPYQGGDDTDDLAAEGAANTPQDAPDHAG